MGKLKIEVNKSEPKKPEYPELPFITVDDKGKPFLICKDKDTNQITCVSLNDGVLLPGRWESVELYFYFNTEQIVDATLIIEK